MAICQKMTEKLFLTCRIDAKIDSFLFQRLVFYYSRSLGTTERQPGRLGFSKGQHEGLEEPKIVIKEGKEDY